MPRMKSDMKTIVDYLKHGDKRANIPTEELRDFVADQVRIATIMIVLWRSGGRTAFIFIVYLRHIGKFYENPCKESQKVRSCGARDPYDKLKRALRAEIDESAWQALYRTESLPFNPPKTGKIAVKVINHYGDEVLKVYSV